MLRGLLLVLVCASAASAQPKPVCAFQPDADVPAWISCGSISGDASYDDMVEAATQSRLTGFRWVLQMGYSALPTAPAGPVAALAMFKAQDAGLWPYVVAVNYGEEWYERFFAGEFTSYGCAPSVAECLPIIHDWMGRQHAAIKAVTGKPVIWLTGMVIPGRLVPAHTDLVAIDYYPRDGQSFAESVDPVVHAALIQTDLPLVLIPRWFKNTGPYQGAHWQAGAQEPLAAWADGYARWLTHPRVVALWGFLWASRPYADLVGLRDMPAYQAAVKRSLGVK